MAKAAIVILAEAGGHENTGRVVNGLEAAKEFVETDGDEVEVIFDGAGTTWIPELEDEENDYHDLYASVRDEVSVCDYCATAFDVDEAVDQAGLARIADYDGHPSIRDYVDDDYQILTF